MSPSNRTRYDLKWTPAAQAAGVLLCAVLAGGLALRSAARPVRTGESTPVDRRRSAAVAERINPNVAEFASLVRLPAIGPKRAAAILAHRREHGAVFRTAADLTAVHGIGPGIVRRLAPYLSLPASTQPRPEASTRASSAGAAPG